MIHAYRLAEARGNEPALKDLASTIDKGLYKLTSWQVGGPLQRQNSFLVANPKKDPRAIGGVMNGEANPVLRTDVTQHQMHCLILALKHVYNGPGSTNP